MRGPPNGPSNESARSTELSSSDLFALLWSVLADMLGTAASAALLRRAAQKASRAFPELRALIITREALEYQYRVPDSWSEPAVHPPEALCELVRELWVLLAELTGPVVVNRLLQVSELRERGIVPPGASAP